MPFLVQGLLPCILVVFLQATLTKLNEERARTAIPGNYAGQISSTSRVEQGSVTTDEQLSADPTSRLSAVNPDEFSSSDHVEEDVSETSSSIGTARQLLRMWWQMFSVSMLLTAITAGMEQGAWGHYQLSNPPFLTKSFGFSATSVSLFFAICPVVRSKLFSLTSDLLDLHIEQ
eukprot:SAG31_NODE_403_length_16150_cov_12.566588_12_plen_174_part_00